MTENKNRADHSRNKKVMLIGNDKLGRGSSELGKILMRNFLNTLSRQNNPPETIIFINAGVKLAAAESTAIEDLNVLQDRGVKILACGTCLDYFDLKGHLKAGQISNMHDITALLLSEAELISI